MPTWRLPPGAGTPGVGNRGGGVAKGEVRVPGGKPGTSVPEAGAVARITTVAAGAPPGRVTAGMVVGVPRLEAARVTVGDTAGRLDPPRRKSIHRSKNRTASAMKM